jgi:hypothetical protein
VCAEIAAGALVTDTMRKHDVSVTERRAFLETEPGARLDWEQAREASADALYDEAMREARANYGKLEASHARTRIDTLKWAARIRNPRLYGERSTVDLNVRTVDLTAIIRDANARLAASRDLQALRDVRAAASDEARPLIPAALESLL